MIKAVIFDLDGTLTDTIEDLADATNFALDQFRHPAHKVEDYKYFVGTGTDNLIRKAAPKGLEAERLGEIKEKFFEYYRLHYLDKTKPYDGIVSVIDTLRDRGIKLAVCSNKVQEMTEKVVEVLFEGRFEVVVGQNDRFPIKPDPAAPEYIMQKLGVNAAETVFIGDSGVDMQTGKNSGCVSLGVLWGFRTKEELLENGADHLARTPYDIINIIEKV